MHDWILNSVCLSLAALIIMALSPLLLGSCSAKCLHWAYMALLAAFLCPIRFSASVPIALLGAENAGLAASAIKIAALPPSIGALWAADAIALFAWRITRHARFLSAVGRWSSDVSSPEILDLFGSCKDRAGVRCRIGLKVCPCIKTPMVIGFFSPKVLLPSQEIPLCDLSAIFSHELIHVKRKDLLFKALALAVVSVHWLNPIVFLAARQALGMCELSCDEEALKGAGLFERASYGEAIVSMARRGRSATFLSASFFASLPSLKARLQALMDVKTKRFSLPLLIVSVAAGFFCLTGFAISPVAPEMASANPLSGISRSSGSEIEAPTLRIREEKLEDLQESAKHPPELVQGSASLDDGGQSSAKAFSAAEAEEPVLVLVEEPLPASR